MNAPAVQSMTGNLTLPFAQGASTLAITLQASGNATQAPVNPYDFSDYRARFGPLPDTQPNPTYVLAITKDIAMPTQVTVDYVSRSNNMTGSVNLTVPAGTLAGTSFAAWLQADGTSANDVLANPDIQLSTLHMSPAAPDGEAANWWSLVALLGNMARLLWVMSYEKDVIRRQMQLVQTQRYLSQAVKYSLDMLGYDLGVPRFPSRPYSFDEDTIALYHLDDQFLGNHFFGTQLYGNQFFGSQVTTVHDSMTDYAPPGHPGAGTDITLTMGRFGKSVAFRKPDAVIAIPDSTHAFDLPINQSFTFECLVKPDPGTPDGEILARFGNGIGWSLGIGTFNMGIPLNVRLLLNDGTTQVALFANQQLTIGVFTHVAGVIDRQANSAYLYIDGKVIATQSIAGLGALTNTETVRIGSGSTASSAFQGVIDEVRFSHSARTTFNPVLGESDESYRQRLRLFACWTLPTLPNLTDMLNKIVGPIKGITGPNPLVLDDTNAANVRATLPLVIKPASPPTASVSDSIAIIRLLTGGTQPGDGSTLRVGDIVQLGIQPAPTRQQSISWLVINCGKGQANFATAQSAATVSLVGTMPGLLYVKVELTDGQTQTITAGVCTLRILPDPATLTVGATIGDDGTLGITEDVAGQPDDFFHPVYLITHNNPGATYGNNINNRRMQASVARLLDNLLSALAVRGITGPLEVVQAYTPGASSSSAVVNQLSQVGRALILHHPTLTGDILAMLAHSVDFTYVCRQAGEQVLVLQRPAELITISGPQEITEGQSAGFSVVPQALPRSVVASSSTVYTANTGSDTISIIDLTTGLVRDAIKVGWGPVALVLSPDGKRLYSADSLGNTITVMDVDTATGNLTVVQLLPVQQNPVTLAHHPDPTVARLYVACQNDNSLLEVDTQALNVVTRLAIGAGPTGVAVTSDGQQAWVALNGGKQITIVSTASPITQMASIALAQAPSKIAVAPDGKRAYTIQPTDNSLVVLDVPGQAVITTIPLDYSPSGIAVASDSTAVYVTSTNKQQAYLFQPDGTASGSIGVGQTLDNVTALSATTGVQLYVVSQQGNMVGTVDPQKKRAVNIWNLGTGLGEYPSWALDLGPRTRATLNNPMKAGVTLSGDAAGPALLRVVYVLPGKVPPYTVNVRLNDALLSDQTQTPIISKEQYDLIMNILNVFHPLGVDVTTDAIRKYVLEVQGLNVNVIPDYTYPTFRLLGPLSH